MAIFDNLGAKLFTLSGAGTAFGKGPSYKFKSPALNKFVQVRNKVQVAGGAFAAGIITKGAIKKGEAKFAGSPLEGAAKEFMASDAGGKAFNAVVGAATKKEVDDKGVTASYRLIEWIKKNFVWVLLVLVAVVALPFVIGFMRKGNKRIPSRKKPISRPVKRRSYAGKSSSTRAKQLAALARGRAKRLRNLRAKKK